MNTLFIKNGHLNVMGGILYAMGAVCCALLVSMFWGSAEAAQMTASSGSDPLKTTGDYIIGILTGAAAKTLAVVMVVAAGWAWILGRLQLAWVLSFAGGIVLIFGGASLARTLTSAL